MLLIVLTVLAAAAFPSLAVVTVYALQYVREQDREEREAARPQLTATQRMIAEKRRILERNRKEWSVVGNDKAMAKIDLELLKLAELEAATDVADEESASRELNP